MASIDVAVPNVQALNIPLVAPSLGAVESLITRPATTTHVGMSQEERQVPLQHPSSGLHRADLCLSGPVVLFFMEFQLPDPILKKHIAGMCTYYGSLQIWTMTRHLFCIDVHNFDHCTRWLWCKSGEALLTCCMYHCLRL